MKEMVLGIPVDVLSKEKIVDLIADTIKNPKKKTSLVATAYSEFFVRASRDEEFATILKKALAVTPDGISVLAAADYLKISKGKSLVGKIFLGLGEARKILRGELGEPVTGVWLFENLIGLAETKAWKVFVLGGWNGVSKRSAGILLERFPKLRLDYDEGESLVGTKVDENRRVVEKINKFKPDILFVAYSPVKQEKWIAANSGHLKASVAVGIGGTLNEFVGDLKLAPAWMQAMGLKWLWRLILEPGRWRRMVDAVIVFPWLVFKESLRS